MNGLLFRRCCHLKKFLVDSFQLNKRKEAKKKKMSAKFHQGLNTLEVPMKLHAENRARLLTAFKTAEVPASAIILLKVLFFLKNLFC